MITFLKHYTAKQIFEKFKMILKTKSAPQGKSPPFAIMVRSARSSKQRLLWRLGRELIFKATS